MNVTVTIDSDDRSNAPRQPDYPNAYVAVVPNGRRCPISGLGHAHLYQLLLRGEGRRFVRTVKLRQAGAARGKLLFHVGDLLRWFDALAKEQLDGKESVAP